MMLKLVFVLATLSGVSLQVCNVTPVSTLLQGCTSLKGLTVYSRSGNTVVDDSTCGDLVSIKEFFQEPYFQYKMANTTFLYTLLIVDPDAPNMPKDTFFLHIITANIPGRPLRFTTTCCINDGNKIVRYEKPNPPPGTGAHRYIVLLYFNLPGYVVQDGDAPQSRRSFNLGAWLKSKRLCGPVAATEFRIKNPLESALT